MPLHDDEPTEQPGGDEPEGKVKASDILNRYGTNEAAALRLAELYADAQNTLYRQRVKNRTLTDERDALRAKLPADGAVLMIAEDADALEAYRALGTPDALKGAQAAATEAQDKLAGLQRDATLRDVRDVTGYDLDILRDIGGAEWQYSIKDEGTEAEPRRVVYVKDGDTEQRIDQHPKVRRVLPALKPAAASQPAAQPYPRQSAGGRAPDMAQQFLDQKQARNAALPNPLAPKQGV